MSEDSEKPKKPQKPDQFFDQPWFKWAFGVGSLSLILVVSAVFFLKEHLRQQHVEEMRVERQDELRVIADNFRITIVRVYQNLQLEHYLAAYGIIASLDQPPLFLKTESREYFEVLQRVGKGLLKDRFFGEAELVFEELYRNEGTKKEARKVLDEIFSHRRLSSAERLLSQSRLLIQEKRWRDAANEIRKAKLEFKSVQLFKQHNVDEQLKELSDYEFLSKHHVHLEEASWEIDDSLEFLNKAKYKEAQKAVARAAKHVGRAAFFKKGTQEVKDLRRKLFDLEAEFSYRAPNLIPPWNKYTTKQLGWFSDFFYVNGYNFDLSKVDSNEIKIGLDFKMKLLKKDYFVVRYKVFYFNGADFFNGHYILPKGDVGITEERSILFAQQIPENFKGQAIKRIDLKVFDQKNALVARINRAFRRPPS